MTRKYPVFLAGTSILLAVIVAIPVLAQEDPASKKTPEKQTAPEEKPVPSNRILNEYGVLPQSALHDGGLNLPPELRIPEQYQYRRPDLQLSEADLTGNQLPPVLTEYKVLTHEVEPGGEIRAIARVVSPYNQAGDFVSLFYNWELGRAAVFYVNFKRDKNDKTLFLGRGKVSKWAAPGRYVVGTTIINDEIGDRKAYWADFHKAMQESDGSPVGFWVTDNPEVDVEGPILTSYQLHTTQARAGQDYIRFEIASEDDKSGLIEAESIWVSPSGRQSVRASMVMLGNQPGTFKGIFQIPKWYEGGAWRMQRVTLTDNATNIRYYFDRDEPLMQGKVVEVAQDPAMVDVEPPEALAVQLTTTEASMDDSVGVTLLVHDNLSGVLAANAMFLSEHGADSVNVKLETARELNPLTLSRPAYFAEPTIFRGSLKLKDTMERGTWRLVRLNLADAAHNYRTYFLGRDELIDGIACVFTGDDDAKGRKATEGQE